MKTQWQINTVQKTTKDEEYHVIKFKDYRGEHIIKIDNARELIEDLDKAVNYKSITS